MIKKVLLIIDVQNYFINRFTKHIPKKITDFINRHKKDFDFILFFRFNNSKNSNWINWQKMWGSPDIDIVPELKRFINKNNVFNRTSFSCFKVKGFMNFIEVNNINEIYISGLGTDACVLSSAMEGYELAFNVKVIADLCASFHGSKYHRWGLEILEKNSGGTILINSKSKI